jgi:hypothetical protein
MQVLKEGGGSSRKMWQSLKVQKRGLTGVKKDGKIETNPELVKECISKHFNKLYQEDTTNETNSQGQSTPRTRYMRESGDSISQTEDNNVETMYERESLCRPFMRAEIKIAVSKLKNFKAGGEDTIVNELLKEGGEPLIEYMQMLYNQCLQDNRVPKSWNKEMIHLIHKKGEYT